MNKRTPLDIFEIELMPAEMKAYLRNNGYSFSKKACEFAISLMRKKDKSTGDERMIEPMSKEKVDDILSKYGVKLRNNVGYNAVYIANMSLADYMKESIEDELHLARHIKCIIDDVDDNPENIFRMWIAQLDGNGIPIPWEDII